MEKYEEMFDKLNTEPGLCRKIDEIEAKFAPVKQLAEAFSEAGVEADEDDVKRFMAYFQMKRFEAITDTEIDENLLKQVAGGEDLCSSELVTYDCETTYNIPCSMYNYHCTNGVRAQS